jgi:protein transport protein SEC31
MSAEAQELVKRSLIVGNFEAAVNCCYKAGNLADALLIAYCGGVELWSQTQQRYLSDQQSDRPFLSLLTGIVQSQWDTLVAESSTSNWKETLAILSSYAQSEEFPRLCIALGDRLDSVGAKENASLCYICALSVSHASRYWISQMKSANRKTGGSMDWKALQDLVMKVTVFQNASTALQDLPDELAKLFSQYAQTLAEQGLLSLAARYCKGTSMESRILRDRLYRSRSSHRCLAEMGSPPEFPYVVETVSAQSQQLPSTSTSSRSSRASRAQPQRQAYETQQQSCAPQQISHGLVGHPAKAATSVADSSYGASPAPATNSDTLPPGWFAIQDPASGMTYYANETTGETTWDRPVTAPKVTIVENMPNIGSSASTPMKDSASVKSTTSSVSSASKLVSKYGDGFVTSASHPELADQYGNVGTSNPYTGVSRPGTAAAVLGGSLSTTEQAPPSGPVDLSTLELEEHHVQMKDTLLGLYDHLVSVSFPSENRQLEEAKRGIDILIKKLARKSIEEDTESKVYSMVVALANHDIRTAAAIQTSLVSTDWKAHKDWLKGIKVLLQLATKKM